MSDTPLIDPRPLEPDWVTDMRPEPSGIVEWSTMCVEWNRELQKCERRTEYHEGTPQQFIDYVSTIAGSPCIGNAEITVDASQVNLPYDTPANWYNSDKVPDDHYAIDWGIKYNVGDYDSDDKEVGTSAYELVSWIAYILEKRGKCVIDLQEHDPTPEYMEIGSMF